MYWQQTEETENGFIYSNSRTGAQCEIVLLLTDRNGCKWYGFADLFKIPYIRMAYAKQVADLFSAGLTKDDLEKWLKQEKDLLKGNDPEKYEKLYALVLEKEALINATSDPLKQHMSLASIYVMEEGEKIDYFDSRIMEQKLAKWRLDEEATAFFLSWHMNKTLSYTSTLANISRTALSEM